MTDSGDKTVIWEDNVFALTKLSPGDSEERPLCCPVVSSVVGSSVEHGSAELEPCTWWSVEDFLGGRGIQAAVLEKKRERGF